MSIFMLSTSDKIFSNLYGQEEAGLSSSRKLSDWDNTRNLLDQGRDWMIAEVKKSGLRGRGDASFATVVKMAFYA